MTPKVRAEPAIAMAIMMPRAAALFPAALVRASTAGGIKEQLFWQFSLETHTH